MRNTTTLSPLNLTFRYPPHWQEEYQPAVKKVDTTINQMRQEAKYAFTMRVTDTTSTQGDHDSIKNEVAAMAHAKLNSISENEVPIDTIRAIYTKGAGKFTLKIGRAHV